MFIHKLGTDMEFKESKRYTELELVFARERMKNGNDFKIPVFKTNPVACRKTQKSKPKYFRSIKEAIRHFKGGDKNKWVYQALKDKNKTAYGHYWEYI